MSEGYEKLKESVERDCARDGGELHSDGCTDSCNGKCYHKDGLIAPMHTGDIVRYEKHNKIKGNTKIDTFVATSIEMNGEGHIKYGDKCGSKKIKFCRPIGSGCLQVIHALCTEEYLKSLA